VRANRDSPQQIHSSGGFPPPERVRDYRHDKPYDSITHLSILYNEAMPYNVTAKYRLSSKVDLVKKSQFLARMRSWRLGLLRDLDFENKSTLAIYSLR
jgi:hypothetical protein